MLVLVLVMTASQPPPQGLQPSSTPVTIVESTGSERARNPRSRGRRRGRRRNRECKEVRVIAIAENDDGIDICWKHTAVYDRISNAQ